MGEENRFDPMFLQLVISLQTGAMQQMGKMASPVDGKVHRDMETARFTIDMLSMLETKTKGNLTGDEGQLLSSALTQLRLNYVEEAEKDRKGADKGAAEASATKPSEGDAMPEAGE